MCPACGADSRQLTGGCGLLMQEGDLTFRPCTGGISTETRGFIWVGRAHQGQRLAVHSLLKPQTVQELGRLSLIARDICHHLCHCQPWGW